jgi:putative peptide zinc metalloprotease protein
VRRLRTGQFLPWLRLDGYYLMTDVIGVADLFQRIGPVLRSMLPRRDADPRVEELKPWARRAVKIWVVTTVVVLTTGITYALLHAPPFLERAWASLLQQIDTLQRALSADHLDLAVAAAVSAVILVLPVMVCRLAGRHLAVRRARAQVRRAADAA